MTCRCPLLWRSPDIMPCLRRRWMSPRFRAAALPRSQGSQCVAATWPPSHCIRLSSSSGAQTTRMRARPPSPSGMSASLCHRAGRCVWACPEVDQACRMTCPTRGRPSDSHAARVVCPPARSIIHAACLWRLLCRVPVITPAQATTTWQWLRRRWRPRPACLRAFPDRTRVSLLLSFSVSALFSFSVHPVKNFQ